MLGAQRIQNARPSAVLQTGTTEEDICANRTLKHGLAEDRRAKVVPTNSSAPQHCCTEDVGFPVFLVCHAGADYQHACRYPTRRSPFVILHLTEYIHLAHPAIY